MTSSGMSKFAWTAWTSSRSSSASTSVSAARAWPPSSGTLDLAGTALDGPFDVVCRDRVLPRLVHGRRERHVGLDARPALPSRHLDRADQLPEHPAALLVGGFLLPLDGGPLGMPRHLAH